MDNYFKKKGQIVKKIKMNTPSNYAFAMIAMLQQL